jgi:hypothetical protein
MLIYGWGIVIGAKVRSGTKQNASLNLKKQQD